MAIKKEVASIGLMPIETNTASGIQSKAVSKDTNFPISKPIPHSQFNEDVLNFIFDNFNQVFHIIIKGGSHD